MPADRPKPPTLAALSLAVLLAGCGKKGPPLPPIRILPAPPQEVRLRQTGPDVLLTARLPGKRTDGMPLGPGARVRILRMRPSEGLRPGAVSPQYLVRQFEKGAQVLATLAGEELATAAPGGLLRYRDGGALPGGAGGPPPRFLYSLLVIDSDGKRSPLPVPLLMEPVPPPPAPHDLRVETAEGEVRLRWDTGEPAPPHPLYNVYRQGPGDPAMPLAPLNRQPIEETIFIDREFIYKETYRYVVRALAAREPPPRESADSPEVEVRPIDIYPPAAPAGVAVAAEGGTIKIYWFPSPEPDLAGYRVYRRTEGGTEAAILGTAGPTEASFTDGTAVPGVRYHYTVTAFDAADPSNESVRSEERSETLTAEAAAPVLTPVPPR